MFPKGNEHIHNLIGIIVSRRKSDPNTKIAISLSNFFPSHSFRMNMTIVVFSTKNHKKMFYIWVKCMPSEKGILKCNRIFFVHSSR